ncbi:hypothetical protein [Streptomyces sp. NBC_01190]|uniref:hypothetical protein n=1 Tax=Streptomyces sp. NBC_01190 TaxID=2903767 RepID=UPI00386F05A9|nr:hypothetical protein OG519_20420 [Streptomyces sp. NBC_01190]
MITEPEMWDESGADRPADVLSDADRAPGADRSAWRGRPWAWALGGVVASSAVWAALLNGTALGHDTAPDLHGYHLGGSLCDGDGLKPLTDALHGPTLATAPTNVRRGPALDQASCTLSVEASADGAGTNEYNVSVSVELHKKTDPRAEFENASQVRISSVTGGGSGGSLGLSTSDSIFSGEQVEPLPGLADGAFLESRGPSEQTLEVLHGGAVLTIGVYAYSGWSGPGNSPGAEPPQPDITDLRPVLPVAMRHLMRVLAS